LQNPEPSFLEIADELLSSFDGWRTFDSEGNVRLGWIQAPEDQTPDHTLTSHDVDDARGGYVRIAGGEPPKEVEVEYLHTSYLEQSGDLLSDTTDQDRAQWAKPYQVVKRKVPGATQIYLLSPREPYHVPARWTIRAGARAETVRIRDRVTRREGFRLSLLGTGHFYGSILPGDYVQLTHARAPSGTVTGVIWRVRWLLATDTMEITASLAEAE